MTQQLTTTSEKSLAVSLYLQKLSKALNSDDLQIAEYKYSEVRIKDMTGPELTSKAAQCLLRVHVITGWNLPDDQNYIQLLTEEFCKKLQEDFETFNFCEIVYAFRKSVGIKDWGKNMNLELVCQVLSSYSLERSRVSLEEEKLIQPVQKIYSDEEILNERRSHIELAFQAMRKGKLPILHDYFIEVLTGDSYLNPEETIQEFFVRKLGTTESLYKKE